MLTKKTWEHRELAGDSPLGRYRIERWEGWYLFGRILLWKRQTEVYFAMKDEPLDPPQSERKATL